MGKRRGKETDPPKGWLGFALAKCAAPMHCWLATLHLVVVVSFGVAMEAEDGMTIHSQC